MSRIPNRTEFSLAWRGLVADDRRRIVRAVNRGTLLDSRKEAALAVVLARRQQKFWRLAWMLAPVVSLTVSVVVDAGRGWIQFAANALLGAAVLGGMSVFFLRKARLAEASNLEHATHGRKRTTG